MFRIALCDDNKIVLEHTKSLVEAYVQKTKAIACIKSFSDPEIMKIEVEEDVHAFDLYIMDIEMPGITGLDLAKLIRNLDESKDIILLTSHMKYVLEGYTYSVLRYIPKPAIEEKLPEAIEVAYRKSTGQNYFLHQNRNGMQKIFYDNIMYISKEQKYCILHMDNGKMISLRKTMQEFFDTLDTALFVYIHRSAILNIRHVKELMPALVLLNAKDEPLKVSRKFEAQLKVLLNSYWGNTM